MHCIERTGEPCHWVEPDLCSACAKNVFNLDFQYKLYLQRVQLNEGLMPPNQKQELKRVFFGACAQMLTCLRDDLSKLDEEPAVNTLQDMLNQVGDFWLKEQNKQN